jgi:hypothetical protein
MGKSHWRKGGEIMTIQEAREIIAKTKSPKLKRDMERFIRRKMQKGDCCGENGKTAERNKPNRI